MEALVLRLRRRWRKGDGPELRAWGDAALPRWGKGRCGGAGATLFAPVGQRRCCVARLILAGLRGKACCGAVCLSGRAGRRAGRTGDGRIAELEAQLGEAGALADVQAQLDAANEQLESVNAELESRSAELETANAELESSEAAMRETEAQLAAANQSVADLQAQIESSDAAIAELEGEIAAAEAELTAANDKSAEQKTALEAQIASLNDDLAAEQSALAEAKAAHAQAQAEFEQRLSELRAYHIEREVSAGESYLATQTGDMLVFDQTGLAVDATLANSENSANNVVFTLEVDGEVIYTSEPIAPGESVSSIQLEAPLAPGNYEAMAIQTAYAADGASLTAVRIPITILAN